MLELQTVLSTIRRQGRAAVGHRGWCDLRIGIPQRKNFRLRATHGMSDELIC